MAAIFIRQFGGMMPSANRKAIPEAAASLVRNINPRFGDFRPFPVASNLATGAAGNTVYKFDGSNTFLTKQGDVSFVRGPIPTDTTERTYYTGDGTPKVTDLSGAVRQLGVPAPTNAPTVTINVVNELSTEESDVALLATKIKLQDALWNNREWFYTGLLDGEMGSEFAPSAEPWSFNFLVPGAAVGNAWVPSNPSHKHLIDLRLGFKVGIYNNVAYGMVPLSLRGLQLRFDANLVPTLQGFKDPSDLTGLTRLLTDEEVNTILVTLASQLAPADSAREDTINRMRALKMQFTSLVNSSQTVALSDAEAVKAFYALPVVVDDIAKAKLQAARAIYDAINTFNHLDN